MARLTWSLDEKRSVALQAAVIRRSDKLLTIRDALYRAQGEVLPDHRKKSRLTWHLEKAMVKRVETLESNPAAIPRQDPVALIEPAAPPPPPPEHPLVIAVREFGMMLGAAIAKELAPLITERVAAAVKANGNGAHLNGHDNAPRPGDEIATKLPEKFVTHKIGVMGLLPEQQHMLKRAFPYLDFRWLDGNAKGDTVRGVAKHCDAVFMMAKFISHGRQDKVPSEKRVLVNGGMSSLERLVGARFPRSTSMEPAQAAAHH